MKLTENQELAKRLLGQALQHSQTDKSFRRELLESPLDAIEKLTGEKIRLPKNTKMVVIDPSDPNTLYFDISAKPLLDGAELTEAQLEFVAGGAADPNEFLDWLRSWF